jgi:MFS family permease
VSDAVPLRPPRRLPGLLGQRGFRRLWIGETTSSFGSSVSSFALPLVALSVLHASVLTISILTAAAWVPWLVVGLPAGAWVDRLPRRPVMITADLVSIGTYGSVALAAGSGWLTTVQLVFAALVAGVATVFFATAYRAFLPALVAADDLLEANAKLQGSEQVARMAGPGAAGLIAQATSAIGGIVVDVASYAVSVFCLMRIDVDEPAAETGRRPLRDEIAEGLGVVWNDSLLRANAVFGCLSNLMLTGYQAILIVFLIRIVGLGPGVAGTLLAVASLGGVCGALLARRAAARLGSARAVLVCRVALSPFGLLIPLAQRGIGVACFLLGSVALIGGVVAGNVIWSGFVQTYYPARMLGRISTGLQVVNYGAIPLGAVLAGGIADALGVRVALWLMLAGLVLSSFVLLSGPLLRLRELPAPAS